jgi:type I restriction enzyme S subunit
LSLIKGIRERIANKKWNWIKLDTLIKKGVITLNRGNIIPKHIKDDEYTYPVYSSSTQNSGLMGYSNSFMFDKALITWSIDGGGNFFYRNKHKFNVTNVCGIMQVDESVYSYRFIAEMLIYQHSKMKFDYQSKAHPSVISSLYSLPEISLAEQEELGKLFEVLTKRMQGEILFLDKLKEQEKYLLSKMFI